VTENGGAYNSGTIFKLASDGYAVRHSFAGYPTDGAKPLAPPIIDAVGDIYGTTLAGGNGACTFGSFQGCGIVFVVNSAGDEGTLHNFEGWPTEDARRLVESYVEHYNNVRLNSATGYVTPKDVLAGRQQEIHAERDRKLEAARQQRQSHRQQAA
jgi:hypothetical protein